MTDCSPERALALERLLCRPDLWRGVTAGAVLPASTCGTGFSELDAQLPGGGWPRGQVTELLVAHEGSGVLSLLAPALACIARSGGALMVVAPVRCAWRLHAPAWAGTGIALQAMVLVHPANLRDMLWAVVQGARCPSVGAVVCWPDFRVPVNGLRRLQVAAGEGGGCVFAVRPMICSQSPSPAPLRLALHAQGARLQIEVLKRRGQPASKPVHLRPRPFFALREETDALVRPDPGVPRPALLIHA